MTKDEIGDLIEALPQGLDADDFIYRLVNWVVDMEREACAKLCESRATPGTGSVAILNGAADAIRARGEK